MSLNPILEEFFKKHMTTIAPDPHIGIVFFRDEEGIALDSFGSYTDMNSSDDKFFLTIEKAAEVLLSKPLGERVNYYSLSEPKDVLDAMGEVISLDNKVKADLVRVKQLKEDLSEGFTEEESQFHRILGDNCLFIMEKYCGTNLYIESYATNRPFKDTGANSFYITALVNGRNGTIYTKSDCIEDGNFSYLRKFVDDIRNDFSPLGLIYGDEDLSQTIPFQYVEDARVILNRASADMEKVEKYPDRMDYAVAGRIKNLKGINQRRAAHIFITDNAGDVNVDLRIGRVKKSFISENPRMFCKVVLSSLKEEFGLSDSKDPDLQSIEWITKMRYSSYSNGKDIL